MLERVSDSVRRRNERNKKDDRNASGTPDKK